MHIKNRDEIVAHENSRGREIVVDIIEAGLAAVDPYSNTRKLIRIENEKLFIGGHPEMDLSGYGDEVIDLSRAGDIYVIGAGKTVQRQAKALEDTLGDRLTAGAVTIKNGEENLLKKIEVTEGAHPVPDEKSWRPARSSKSPAGREGRPDFVLFSGSSPSSFPGRIQSGRNKAVTSWRQYGDQALSGGDEVFSAVNSGRIMMMIHPARVA
jgi:glycerate-2-kinase